MEEKEHITIAICDDERYFQTKIKEILTNYQEENDIPLSIDIFESGKELLKLEMELVRYKIVFLDIKMDEIDGILTARTIGYIYSIYYCICRLFTRRL